MELPQARPFGTEGRKPTHDFLSLYSPAQQDPRPCQGGYVKTHDFLQPLEQEVETTAVGKPPPSPPPSVEHILPGGIGTYSISHISYINQMVPKPEGGVFTAAQASSSDRNDENSNCSSYTGSGFTLWEESVVKKGKTGKENIAEDGHVIRDAGMKLGGQLTTLLEPSSLSSSNHKNRSNAFSTLSPSQPLSAKKNQSFMDMIKSAQSAQEDDDDEEAAEEFVIKKEPFSHHKGNMSVRVDRKSTDQKPNTPRSKHSATEQRRRSKINDRFQMLRELIPNSDQKRDKASFLFEVIEYIQFLQEKVHKYESHQGYNQPPSKLMPWRNSNGLPEGFVDQSLGTNFGSGSDLMFAAKFDENNISASPTIPRNGQNLLALDMSIANTLKEMNHHPGLTNKASSLPVPLQPKIFSAGGSSSSGVPIPPRLPSYTENRVSQPQSQSWQSRSCTTDCTVASDKLKDQDLTIESGTVSISSDYSQGLLNTLTQALQSSGVNLSQASISVQIDLGKGTNSKLNSSTSIVKDDVPSSNQTMPRSRLASTGDESDQTLKRLKKGRS